MRVSRILAIDWGKKRIGLAICDELRISVQGLPTLVRKNRAADIEALCELIRDREVGVLLVGEPLGRLGSTSQAEQFGRTLAKRTKLDLIMWDEQLTSFEADWILREDGLKETGVGRIEKGDTDRGAAAVILLSYLNSF